MGRFAVIALACCKSASEPTPPPPAPPPPPDAALPKTGTDVTVTIDGKPHALRYGFARGALDDIEIELTSDPYTCADQDAGKQPTGYRLTITMPPGPGGKYYEGSRVGATVDVEAIGQTYHLPDSPPSFTVPATYTMLGPDSVVDLTDIGPRLRGQLDGKDVTMFGVAEAHGAFDVAACGPLPKPKGLPVETATKPAAKTALALVTYRPATVREALDHEPSVPYLEAIHFYDGPADCPVDPKKSLGAVQSFAWNVPSPQPALYALRNGEVWPAWIMMNQPVRLAADATIGGRFIAQSYDKRSFGGTFTAKLCWSR